MFGLETKKRRHENAFPQECAKAFDMVIALVTHKNA